MRILHVIIRLGEDCGGPTHGLAALARAQATMGDEVTILPCCTLEGEKKVLEQGLQGGLLVLPPAIRGNLGLYSPAVDRAVLRAAANADIIHVHGTWRCHLMAASRAARKLGVPWVVRPAGNLGRIPRSIKRFSKWLYLTLIERRAIERASALHCCTAKELEEVLELGLHPRHFIIPQPVEDALAAIDVPAGEFERACPGIGPGDDVVLYLGRLTAIKQLEVLVEAFTRIARRFLAAHLVLAGPLEDRQLCERLRHLAREGGVAQRMHMPGLVRGATKAAVFRRATVFVQPSRHENFGLSTAEALLFGRTCIVNSGVALSDEIAAAGAGIRYSGGAQELVGPLEQALSDASFREACQRNAQRLSRNYRPGVVAGQLRREYQQCLGHPPVAAAAADPSAEAGTSRRRA